MAQSITNNLIKLFEYYKSLGEKTIQQLQEESLFWQPDNSNNNIATIVKHLSGNMLSRWTDFLTSDGEKEWRNRDDEFVDNLQTAIAVQEAWQKGWKCLLDTLNSLTDDDLNKIIYIRNMGHTVLEAIHRQLGHYSYHIGQIVLLGKMIQKENWTSLSIPKGASNNYNQEKFAKPKSKKHFTDDL